MNKFKKAAEHFSSYIGNDCYSEKMQNYCELAVEALEKQIPKKPEIKLNGTTGLNTFCHCPNCKSIIAGNKKYCDYCGQKLDWGFTSED